MDKSIAFASPWVPSLVRQEITHITGICFTDDLGKYLGVLLLQGRCSKQKFEYIVQKVQQRRGSWKSKNLSLAGCCTLVQFVLSSVPAYAKHHGSFNQHVTI